MQPLRLEGLLPIPAPIINYSFLKSFRDRTQYVIDEIWFDEKIPSMKELHYRFYKVLRSRGFRAHHCHKIERRAKEIVKAVKRNMVGDRC